LGCNNILALASCRLSDKKPIFLFSDFSEKEQLFPIKRMNLGLEWCWNVQHDTCAICRNLADDPCMKCQSELTTKENGFELQNDFNQNFENIDFQFIKI